MLPFRARLAAAAPGFAFSVALFFGFFASRFDFCWPLAMTVLALIKGDGYGVDRKCPDGGPDRF